MTDLTDSGEAPRIGASPVGRGPTALVIVLASTMAVGTFTGPAVSVLAPFLRAELLVSRTQIGWLVGMVAMVAMVVSPLAGKAADRLGPRRVILAVFALAAASSSLIATSVSYAWLVAATAVGGLATSAGNPGTNKLITEQFPAGRRGTVMGIKQSGVQAAVFLCGLALPPLAGAFGWRVAAGALVPIAAAGLLATFRCLPQDRSVRGRAPLALRDAGHRSAMIGHLAAYAFMMGAGAAALSSFLPLYSEEAVGLSPVAAGATSAVMGLTGIVARVVWGRATEHAPTFFLPLAWQGGLAGIAVLLIATASKVPQLVWLGSILAGASAMSWTVVAMLAVVVRVPATQAGRMTGRLTTGFMAGYAVSPVITGMVVDATGRWEIGWLIVGSLSVGSLVLALAAMRRDLAPPLKNVEPGNGS